MPSESTRSSSGYRLAIRERERERGREELHAISDLIRHSDFLQFPFDEFIRANADIEALFSLRVTFAGRVGSLLAGAFDYST